jgi:hypothetical protein
MIVEQMQKKATSQVVGPARRARPSPPVALGRFTIDQEAEPFLECERRDVWLLALLLECPSHAGETERDQAVVAGMSKHRVSFGQW